LADGFLKTIADSTLARTRARSDGRSLNRPGGGAPAQRTGGASFSVIGPFESEAIIALL